MTVGFISGAAPKRVHFGTYMPWNLFELKGAGVKLVVLSLFGNQLFMVTAFDYSSGVKHHYNVGILYGRKPVGDYKNGTSEHEGVHSLLDYRLGTGVDARGRLVEYHNRGIGHGGSRNGQQLALTLGQSRSVALKHGVVAVRQH